MSSASRVTASPEEEEGRRKRRKRRGDECQHFMSVVDVTSGSSYAKILFHFLIMFGCCCMWFSELPTASNRHHQTDLLSSFYCQNVFHVINYVDFFYPVIYSVLYMNSRRMVCVVAAVWRLDTLSFQTLFLNHITHFILRCFCVFLFFVARENLSGTSSVKEYDLMLLHVYSPSCLFHAALFSFCTASSRLLECTR